MRRVNEDSLHSEPANPEENAVSRESGNAVPSPLAPPPKRGWRERTGERLAERPLLRTLALNPISGVIVLMLIAGMLVLSVSFPKIWRVTPAGFEPVVYGSLLDFAQAWSLARNGRQQMEEGNYVAAARSFLNATKNNQGNPELFRDMLRAFAHAENISAAKWTQAVDDSIQWLFHLAHTNRADVFLAARAYDVLDHYDRVLALLKPRADELPPELYGIMAKAVFATGDVQAFPRWWKRAQAADETDSELDLYHAAWLAGWGPVEKQAEALQKLQAATGELNRRGLANHLLLKVYRHRQDVERYHAVLARLEGFQGDRLGDHINYWLLLKAHGREKEALKLARDYPYPPRDPGEATQLARAFAALGDREGARNLLERYEPVWGDGPPPLVLPFWAALGDLYIEAKDWDALIRLGRAVRSLPQASAALSGFGWFVEGRGLAEQGRRKLAEQAFDHAVENGFPTPQMSMEISIILLKLRFPRPAFQLLAPLQEQLADNVRYWQALFEATYALRADEALLFKAARRAMDLDPANPVRQINYAVALLINRQRPEEAAKYSLTFLNTHPHSLLARLNHAHALAMLKRAAEAERLLNRVPPSTDPELRNSRAMVRLEISLSREDAKSAKAALAEIDEKLLFPAQRQWLASVRKRLNLLSAPVAMTP